MTNDINIFDRKLIRKRREKAARHFSQHDFLKNIASDYIIERLLDKGNKYQIALDIGCHTGGLGQRLMINNLSQHVVYSDLSAGMAKQAGHLAVVADEEFLPFNKLSFNLITSSMSLHWVNDLPGALLQMRRCLKQGGLFIAAMPGIATLKELRHCLMEAEIEITGGTAPHVSPFADVKTLGHLMQRAGFAEPVADSETVQISYPNIHSLLNDLRISGEGNALIKRNPLIRKNVLQRAAEKYAELYSDNEGGILATIEIITITGLAV